MSRFDISYFTSFNGQYIATIVDKMTHKSKKFSVNTKLDFSDDKLLEIFNKYNNFANIHINVIPVNNDKFKTEYKKINRKED